MMQNIYDNEHFYEGYKKIRNNRYSYNEMIEMPIIKEQLPDIKDKKALDIGCGMGKFIQYMLPMNPQSVTGIDISHNMISYARQYVTDPKVRFIVSDIMEFNGDETYDVIISSLAFHYIKDYNALIEKLGRLITDEGTLIFSTEHPVTTATKHQEQWVNTPEMYDHYKLDHYFDESARPIQWLDTEVVRYHRTVGTLINTLIDHNFIIERVIDTGNTELSIANWDDQDILKTNHRPPFMVIKARKGE